MTTQMFWIIFAVFVLGLFVGTNLGVMLMCVLHVAGERRAEHHDLSSVPVQVES